MDTTCQAGVAKIDITPPIGVSLQGYFHNRVGKTVRDPLYAQAAVIQTPDTKFLWIACDLCYTPAAVTQPAKLRIAQQTDIPIENIMICASHTHTGPMLNNDIPTIPYAAEYAQALPDKLAAVALQANQAMFPATLRLGSIDAQGYNFNRLYRLLNGKEQHGRRNNDADVIGPSGPVDPQLQTLSIHDDTDQLRGIVINFGMHPDVIGGGSADFISSDWPGLMAKNIAHIYGPQTACLFFFGTAGDINQAPYKDNGLPNRGPQKAESLGRGLAGAAACAAERANPLTPSPSYVSLETIPIPYYTRQPQLMHELKNLKQQEAQNPDTTGFRKYIIDTTENWPNDNQTAQIPMHIFRIGDVAIVCLPAEVFTEIGLEIKHFSPAPQTMIVTLANDGGFGYIATSDQAHRGSYDNTPFQPKWGTNPKLNTNDHGGQDAYGTRPILSRKLCIDAGRRITDAAIVVLNRMWPGHTLDNTDNPKHGI